MLTSRHKKAPESFDSEALNHDYYIWVKNGGKTMADVMVKILMKGAKAIGKTAAILIIWTAHKLENK